MGFDIESVNIIILHNICNPSIETQVWKPSYRLLGFVFKFCVSNQQSQPLECQIPTSFHCISLGSPVPIPKHVWKCFQIPRPWLVSLPPVFAPSVMMKRSYLQPLSRCNYREIVLFYIEQLSIFMYQVFQDFEKRPPYEKKGRS